MNGYAPEKGTSHPLVLRVNGYTPEKSADLIDFIHFYVLLGTDGHQKEAILALLAADCNPGKLNGYAPEYVLLFLIILTTLFLFIHISFCQAIYYNEQQKKVLHSLFMTFYAEN